ncbi:uncharacterized protein LOC135686517 [Rhopilema esculentum]|uniref:uncharacterized protein LOC135686517 n=1 Tax=Rhopilema esculentum TaxID=499914 RepID=UPI0031DCB0D7|eukprot:gene880-10631_t
MPRGNKERVDSGLESGEKSHNVHSANYKHGEVLKKELQSLNREEKNTACSITIEQRIVTTRFRNRLARSVELMKHHEKMRSRFHHKEQQQNGETSIGKINAMQRQNRNSVTKGKLRARPRSSNDASDQKEFSLKRFTDLGALKNRPQTAVEAQSKLWIKRAETAKDRVVRAKSAPPSSWRNCEDIMRKLNSGGGGFYAANKVHRPLSRAKFHEVFDSDSYKKFREEELKMQEEEVLSFIESVKELKLVPWYPGPVDKKDETFPMETSEIDRSKFKGFVTRIDSYF